MLKIKGLKFKARPLLVWTMVENNVSLYDGKEQLSMSKDEFREYEKNFTSISLQKRDVEAGMKESYDNYVKMAEELKTASKGLINLYRTGTPARTALYLLNKLKAKKDQITVDKLSADEIDLLLKTNKGAIIFGLDYVGSGHSYDFKSFYPSILSSNNFLVPVKQGTWKTIEKFSEMVFYQNLTYGYYRCIVHKSGDKKKDRFFRFNKQDVYTHFDVMSAKNLGLKVELIKDGKPNVYYYTRKELMTGVQLFANFRNYMFALKEKNVLGAKLILNSLWGALCECKHSVVEQMPEDEQPEGLITDIQNNSDGTITYHMFNGFSYDFARLKPFLMSRGRLAYSTLVYPHSDKVVRCHTDSIIATEKLDIKTGTKLGDLVYEGYYETFANLKKNRKGFVPEEKTYDIQEIEDLDREFREMVEKDNKKYLKK